jgi:hypothetical protein
MNFSHHQRRYSADRSDSIASLRASLRGRTRLARLADAILAELRARPPPAPHARRPGPLQLEDGSFIWLGSIGCFQSFRISLHFLLISNAWRTMLDFSSVAVTSDIFTIHFGDYSPGRCGTALVRTKNFRSSVPSTTWSFRKHYGVCSAAAVSLLPLLRTYHVEYWSLNWAESLQTWKVVCANESRQKNVCRWLLPNWSRTWNIWLQVNA